jgi:hypothetical protein
MFEQLIWLFAANIGSDPDVFALILSASIGG